MAAFHISYTKDKTNDSVNIALPASKSISNRVLIINALAGGHSDVENLAHCDDTDVMVHALTQSSGNTIDIGAAGTSMRFLTAYLSNTPGTWTITGSQRMKERPISVLVDALHELGAEIAYKEKEGFPPLHIQGKKLNGGEIEIDGSISSQYISALLMIAPTMKNGLSLKLNGEVASVPYIEMTLAIMREYGISSQFDGNTITVPAGEYKHTPYVVESDWSGSSYWFEVIALSQDIKEFILPNLYLDSLQGDSVVVKIFSRLGVRTTFEADSVYISKQERASIDTFEFDFVKCPDLAQTVVCTCLGLRQKFHFKGLKSLKIKETNRIAALIAEAKKLGFVLSEPCNGELVWDGTMTSKDADAHIDTYKDHRMAMAFAPLAITEGEFAINDPSVVSKSYPDFWNELKHISQFSISEE